MKQTINEIWGEQNKPYNDIEFVAKIKGRFYLMRYPISSLSPDYDFHILMTPNGTNGWKLDKTVNQYFKNTDKFEVIRY